MAKRKKSESFHSKLTNTSPRTLVIDIGATGVKAMVLNDLRRTLRRRLRRETPLSGKPGTVIDVVVELVRKLEPFDRVSVGFPGVVIGGIVKEAPNLAADWQDFNIRDILQEKLKKPVLVANDADVQGFGAISGIGVELVVTLGTGVGTSLFVDGHLLPNLEIGRDKLRDAALKKVGKKRWNKRLGSFITKLENIFHFDRLYIGGGNSVLVDVKKLAPNVTVVSNLNGLMGGLELWRNITDPSRTESKQSRFLHKQLKMA